MAIPKGELACGFFGGLIANDQLKGRRRKATPVSTGTAMHQHRPRRIPEQGHQLVELLVREIVTGRKPKVDMFDGSFIGSLGLGDVRVVSVFAP